MARFPKIALHWKILIGMFLGLGYGMLAINNGWLQFTKDFIDPFGQVFIRALKLIAVPLVLFTLVSGITSLKDISSLGRMGGQTIAVYLGSTVLAITIGLIVVNVFQPWSSITPDLKNALIVQFGSDANSSIQSAANVQNNGPLQFLVDFVPPNLIAAASDNGNMLQVIFFAVLFGISLVAVPEKYRSPVENLFHSLSEVILKMVDFIMYFAPIGTFALMGSLLVEIIGSSDADILDLLLLLISYCVAVIFALAIMIFVIYPLIISVFTKQKFLPFLKSISAPQLLAFSTSSSAATLPLTIETAKEKLKIKEEVAGFVLPLGATINMDGTSCYQAIAAVFIANVMGFDLTVIDQLSIVLTATLASIGSAAVPGAGMVMLAIVLSQLQIPMEGIAIILGVDRILDMCRTVVNVTGDLTVVTLVNQWSDKKRIV
jgi:Na+/H+-dicarboxylate symporter